VKKDNVSRETLYERSVLYFLSPLKEYHLHACIINADYHIWVSINFQTMIL